MDVFTIYTNDLHIRQGIKTEVSGHHKQTVLQHTSIVEKRNTCLKRIQQFCELQQIHMPGFDVKTYAQAHWSLLSTSSSIQVEDTLLFLPSGLSSCNQSMHCFITLVNTEDQIQKAQATDSLEDLCHNLHTQSFTNWFKITNVTGQIRNTINPLAKWLKAYVHWQMTLEHCIHTQWQAKWQPTQNGAKAIISTLTGLDWLSASEDHTASIATESAASVKDSITQVIELDISKKEQMGVEYWSISLYHSIQFLLQFLLLCIFMMITPNIVVFMSKYQNSNPNKVAYRFSKYGRVQLSSH